MNLKGATTFLQGIGIRNLRPALYGWFFNLIASLVIYAGFYKLLADAVGDTPYAYDVIADIGLYNLLTDISANMPGNFSLLLFLAGALVILYIPAAIFASAGIYSVFVEEDKPTFTNLLSYSQENFFRMLKVFIVNLVNWAIAFAIPGLLLYVIYTLGPSVGETGTQYLLYLWIPLAALAWTFATAIYDFSRVFKLVDDRNVFQAFKKGVGFVFSNKLNILVIFLMYGVSLLIVYLIHGLYMNLTEDLVPCVLVFAAYQFFIIVRYFLKIVVIRAEIEYLEQ